jgi:hypothetical protein
MQVKLVQHHNHKHLGPPHPQEMHRLWASLAYTNAIPFVIVCVYYCYNGEACNDMSYEIIEVMYVT